MKKIRPLILLPLLFWVLISETYPDGKKETRKPGSFNELKVFGKFEVALVQGTEESVTLESEEENFENVLTELEEGKLKVRMKGNFFHETNIKVVVTYKQLKDITASAGAMIDAGSIKGNQIILKANSGAHLMAEVTADSLEAESTQGATMDVSGNVKSLEATVNTGGQLNGFQLICGNAKVKVTTGGTAKVNAKEKLNVSATMGGKVSYKGLPKEVKHSDSMGGMITEIKE